MSIAKHSNVFQKTREQKIKLRELKLRKSFFLWCCGQRMELFLVYGFAKRRRFILKGKYARCEKCKKEQDVSPARLELKIKIPNFFKFF